MKPNELRTSLTALAALYTLVFLFATPIYSQTRFYQGKTISIVHGREPGDRGNHSGRGSPMINPINQAEILSIWKLRYSMRP
jgi:hypothetical protein